MRMVHGIPGFACIAVVLAACSSPRLPREIPIRVPPTETAPERREPQVPEGFLGDPATGTFHRMRCPDAREIDPAHQVFFVTPFDALNQRYAPCERCAPMLGWQ